MYLFFFFLQITQDELKSFLQNMGNTNVLAGTGIRVGGEKYMFLSGTDTICRGKKGTSGIHLAKSKTSEKKEYNFLIRILLQLNATFSALVIGIYDDPIQPGQAASIVEKMADYLASQNY